jgi:hypothetical protein
VRDLNADITFAFKALKELACGAAQAQGRGELHPIPGLGPHVAPQGLARRKQQDRDHRGDQLRGLRRDAPLRRPGEEDQEQGRRERGPEREARARAQGGARGPARCALSFQSRVQARVLMLYS